MIAFMRPSISPTSRRISDRSLIRALSTRWWRALPTRRRRYPRRRCVVSSRRKSSWSSWLTAHSFSLSIHCSLRLLVVLRDVRPSVPVEHLLPRRGQVGEVRRVLLEQLESREMDLVVVIGQDRVVGLVEEPCVLLLLALRARRRRRCGWGAKGGQEVRALQRLEYVLQRHVAEHWALLRVLHD